MTNVGRDIKLENTLLTSSSPQSLPDVRLCDFGYAKNEFVDSRPKSVSGTPDYIAPEVLVNNSYDGKKADIWSSGVMLFVLLTGAPAIVCFILDDQLNVEVVSVIIILD